MADPQPKPATKTVPPPPKKTNNTTTEDPNRPATTQQPPNNNNTTEQPPPDNNDETPPPANNNNPPPSNNTTTTQPPPPTNQTHTSNGAPPPPRATSARTTIKVRNLRRNVIYHLTFDGDIHRLSGSMLLSHIEGVSSVPVDQQVVTSNGFIVTPDATGREMGLRDGSLLLLDTVQPGNTSATSYSARQSPVRHQQPEPEMSQSHTTHAPHTPYLHQPQVQDPYARNHHHHNDNDHTATRRTTSYGSEQERRHRQLSRLEEEIADIRAQEEDLLRRQQEFDRQQEQHNATAMSRSHPSSQVRYQTAAASPGAHYSTSRGSHTTATATYNDRGNPAATARPSYAVSGPHDDVDIDVEIVEEGTNSLYPPVSGVIVPHAASSAADIEELRLVQQDYVWKMEQVRFETERMTREREMRRLQQELEYQAALLDRERMDLERKTQFERCKFVQLQSQTNEEQEIEARFTPHLITQTRDGRF